MKVICINKKIGQSTDPDHRPYGEETELEDYELKYIKDFADLIIYSYFTEPYEGSGNALIRNKDGTWAHTSLSHCSCYGPLENFDSRWYNTLDDLKRNSTADLLQDIYAHLKEAKTYE